MAAKPLEVSDRAKADIKRIAAFYAEAAGLIVAGDAARIIENAIDRIAEGLVVHRPGKRGTRECVLRKFPYIVIYRVYSAKVRIVRVLHQARDYFN